DAFDAAHSNNTRSSATAIGNSPSQLGFNADLTTATDVDYYKIVVPLNLAPATITIQVSAAGLSLLAPTLSVYSGWGNLVASQTAANVFSNSVAVTIANALPLTTYYFEVSHTSSDGFGVGAYSTAVS